MLPIRPRCTPSGCATAAVHVRQRERRGAGHSAQSEERYLDHDVRALLVVGLREGEGGRGGQRQAGACEHARGSAVPAPPRPTGRRPFAKRWSAPAATVAAAASAGRRSGTAAAGRATVAKVRTAAGRARRSVRANILTFVEECKSEPSRNRSRNRSLASAATREWRCPRLAEQVPSTPPIKRVTA